MVSYDVYVCVWERERKTCRHKVALRGSFGLEDSVKSGHHEDKGDQGFFDSAFGNRDGDMRCVLSTQNTSF